MSSGGVANVYDFENHLIQQGGVTIKYDGDGNRLFKTVAGVTTGYLLDDHSPTGYVQVLDEVQGPLLPRCYVNGLELIEQDRIDSSTLRQSTSYNVYDGHGSVRALTDTTGAVTDTYDYDAFGNLIHSTGSTPNVYLYSGEQFDPDLHLYYNRARYLNVSTGRFWNADSSEGDPGAPLSLHRYLYGSDDPIDRRDPSGNMDIAEVATTFAVAGIIINTGSLIYHLHRAFTANSPQEKAIETTLVYTDTFGIFLAFVGGGFIGPTASLAGTGGAITVAVVSRTAILGSLVIPGAANIIYFSGTGSGDSGSSGGSGSGNIGIKDDHVDVPKHNLNQLASTYAEQKQLLIDAVQKIVNAKKLASSADGDAFEVTLDIINSAGKPVTTTIRWFRYTDGTQIINTAFVPPGTP